MDLESSADFEEHVQLKLPSMDNNELGESGASGATNSISSASPPAPLEMDEEATLFYGLIYLGAAAINAPRSVVELQKNISVLNNEIDSRIFVILSIPTNFTGNVRIYDQEAQSEIRSYAVQNILFCVRGRPDGPDGCCFAFTVSHGDTPESVTFLSHVFKAENVEVASKVLSCFGACFQSRQQANSLLNTPNDQLLNASEQSIVFEMNADIREDDGKGGFTSVPKDRINVVKLRKGVEKMVHVTLKQTQGTILKMERCFGVLLCAGWRQKDSDMNLLDMTSMGNAVESTGAQLGQPAYAVSALWNPAEPVFELLNTETAQGIDRYLTIAVDMVLAGVAEPVRFCIDMRARIYAQNERFWQFTKRTINERFYLKVEPVGDAAKSNQQQSAGTNAAPKYRLVKCDRQSDIDNDMDKKPSDEREEEMSDEEIVLSGMGDVSKEVNDDALMAAWRNIMAAWKVENYLQRPRGLPALVRKRGVPEALRGEVWQLLAGAHEIDELLDKYRRLVVEDCHDYDAAIIRDINRTFPANNFFRAAISQDAQPTSEGSNESPAPQQQPSPNGAAKSNGNGSTGQESLLRVCRAYALIDREIGYCQGISFLAAALLLHMPEEQAFCVLHKMMTTLGLRELYLPGFEKLHVALHQMDSYLRRQLPDLADHFRQLGIESHMYASQWFLTLFIAKFPLHLVFHILDVFFLDGFSTLFAVAISLLTISRTDLLKLDFEGVLKYFRINLPKRFRADSACSQLMILVSTKQPSDKLLTKWENEFKQSRLDQTSKVDLTEMLRNENRSLMDRLQRLETENDNLAQELITSKLNLRQELEQSYDTCNALRAELDSVKVLLKDSLEDKWRFESDLFNLKDVCRKETERLEKESARNFAIISEYKEINARLTDRLEKAQALREKDLKEISESVSSCQNCNKVVEKVIETKPDFESSNHESPVTQNGQRSRAKSEGVPPSHPDIDSLVHQLEVELASTKLALVEAQCEIQELRHEQQARQSFSVTAAIPAGPGEPQSKQQQQAGKFGFFQKSISLLKDVTGQVAYQTGATSTSNSAVSTPSTSMSQISAPPK